MNRSRRRSRRSRSGAGSRGCAVSSKASARCSSRPYLLNADYASTARSTGSPPKRGHHRPRRGAGRPGDCSDRPPTRPLTGADRAALAPRARQHRLPEVEDAGAHRGTSRSSTSGSPPTTSMRSPRSIAARPAGWARTRTRSPTSRMIPRGPMDEPAMTMASACAHADFRRARRGHLTARAATAATHRPRDLAILSLHWQPARRRTIPLAAIVGTVEATTDFDASFRPDQRARGLALAEHRARPPRRPPGPPDRRDRTGGRLLRPRRAPPCLGRTCPRARRDRGVDQPAVSTRARPASAVHSASSLKDRGAVVYAPFSGLTKSRLASVQMIAVPSALIVSNRSASGSSCRRDERRSSRTPRRLRERPDTGRREPAQSDRRIARRATPTEGLRPGACELST